MPWQEVSPMDQRKQFIQDERLALWLSGAPGVRAALPDVRLPGAIRTDNGVPFASTGLHGLTQFNVWWMRLEIVHQRIRPACPQENGCHERMHETLKYEATRPPK